ncbi:hypothetical protein CLIB1423_05S06040 [[Candida] railenensis]|uniref:Uncharacterized protein n=1 Tax=[Candida] railenensis TaxID=45579 RepID=A0A9P0VY39_9ASCO|nr:hypothetical protein CLIB1423_05S06040 [[Candida] railenensis]
MRKSKDDLSLTARPPTQDERRTRSSSPVKNRKNLPTDFYDDDNDIWSMNENSFNDQVKSLSSSPIANKLHISTSPGRSKYVIPIPFQLKLPPKLSSANQSNDNSRLSSPVATPKGSRASSPSRSVSPKQKPKQVRLVYTGNGYEKLETSDEEENAFYENESLLQQRIKMSPRVNLGFVKRHAADELSVINEGSETSSRQSTLKRNGYAVGENSQPFPHSPVGSQKTIQNSLGSPATIKSSPEIEMANNPNDTIVVNPSQQSQSHIQHEAQFQYQQNPMYLPNHNYHNNHNNNAQKTVNESYNQWREMEYSQPLYGKSIASRSVSDSSISSLGTMGSSIKYSNGQHKGPLVGRTGVIMQHRKEALRDASNSSQRSTLSSASRSSWNSLQESVNLTRREEEYGNKQVEADTLDQDFDAPVYLGMKKSQSIKSNTTLASLEHRLMYSDSNESSSDVDSEKSRSVPPIDATLPLRVSRAATQKLSPSPDLDELSNLEPPSITEFVPPSPAASAMDDLESVIDGYYNDTTNMESDSGPQDSDVSKVSDGSFNEGAGKRFNFPNSMLNVTNSDIAKEKARSDQSSIANSRRSFVDHEGQIEIPDLESIALNPKRKSYDFNSDYDFGSQYTASSRSMTKSATCSALEPLGVPSKEAREFAKSQFNVLHPGEDSDTDIDDIKSIRSSKSTPSMNLNLEQFTYNNKNVPESVPLEIKQPTINQTGVRSSQPPVRQSRHTRHKSMFNFDFNLKELTSKLTRSKSSPDIPNDDEIEATNELTGTYLAENKSEIHSGSSASDEIIVAEPPTPVTYAVDFKDNQNIKSTSDDDAFHKKYNYVEINRTLSKLNQASAERSLPISNGTASNASSYQSSRSFNSNSTTGTSASETESVIIDLTEDKFEVFTVQRNDTVTSYKSVTEKTKDGKPIDVVLVEDEDDDRDLASLYSKYRNCWVARSNSTTSSASNFSSIASFESGASGRLVVKPSISTNSIPTRKNVLLNAGIPSSKSTNSIRRYQSARIQVPISASKNSLRAPKPPAKSIKRMEQLAQRRNQYLAVNRGDKNIEKSLPPSPSSTLSSLQNNFDYESGYSFHSYMEENEIA